MNSIYYTNTDSLHVHNEYWSDYVDKGYIGKFPALGKLITEFRVYLIDGF